MEGQEGNAKHQETLSSLMCMMLECSIIFVNSIVNAGCVRAASMLSMQPYHIPGHIGVQLQRQGDVRQRSQRQHAYFAGVRAHHIYQPLRSAFPHCPPLHMTSSLLSAR